MFPLASLLDIGGKLIDKLIPDPEAKAKAQLDLAKLAQEGQLAELTAITEVDKAQIDVNKEEAKSDSLFKSGWRPFVGWSCGFSLVYVGIIEPIARFIAMVIFAYVGPFPVINTELTIQILLGLLGIAGMRSFDKYKSQQK